MNGQTKRHSRDPITLTHPFVLILLVAAVACLGLFYARFAHSQNEKAQISRARSLLKAGLSQEAETAINSVLLDDPDSPAALEILAKVQIGGQRYGPAIETLRHLTKVKPETPGVYANLAECLRITGDSNGAIEQAEIGVQKNPNDAAALAEAARLLKSVDEGARELGYERRLVQLRPEDPPALKMLADALVRYGFYPESAPVIEKLLRLTPTDATVWTLRGEVISRTDQTPGGMARAEASYLKALELTPASYVPNLFLGRLYVRMNQPGKAIPCLLRANQRLPSRRDADFVLAQAYDLLGLKSQAEEARRRFVSWREATEEERQLEKRVAINRESFEDNLDLGVIKLNKRDLSAARFYLGRAVQMRPDSAKADAAAQRLKSVEDSGVAIQQPMTMGQ